MQQCSCAMTWLVLLGAVLLAMMGFLGGHKAMLRVVSVQDRPG